MASASICQDADRRHAGPDRCSTDGPSPYATAASAASSASRRRAQPHASPRSTDPDGTVADWLTEVGPDAATRLLGPLVRLATYADASEEQAADVLAEAFRAGGVRHLEGSWASLVEQLRRAASADGAIIKVGTLAEWADPCRMAGLDVAFARRPPGMLTPASIVSGAVAAERIDARGSQTTAGRLLGAGRS